MRTLIALIFTCTLAAASAIAQTSIPAPPDVAAPPADAAKMPSGLATKVIKPGTGKDPPAKDDLVQVDYTGGGRGKRAGSGFRNRSLIRDSKDVRPACSSSK